jgi:hypothetical protein
MPAERVIRVDGLSALQRAFAVADRELSRKLREALRDAAEPVRADAEQRATSQIPRIGLPWSRMRVGVTRSSVYVAPNERGSRRRGTRRPNLAALLLGRAMEPALAENIERVEREVEQVLDDIALTWEQA